MAAKPVTKRSNFNMKYPCVLPQTCRGARNVCAVKHAHSHFFLLFFFYAYTDELEISASAADLAHSQEYTQCAPHHTYTYALAFERTVLILL